MYEYILNELNKNIDINYKKFNDKLLNTKYNTLGVRVPIIKNIAKNVMKEKDIEDYLNSKCDYYESLLIKGLVITNCKDVIKTSNNLYNYFKVIDSWALCDTVCSNAKIYKKNKEELIKLLNRLLKGNNWQIRGALILMKCYLIEEKYLEYIFNNINSINSSFYYVKMAIAWLLCDLYIKFPNNTKRYLENNKINDEIFKMTKRKINDSYRVSNNDKKYINNMKR